MTRERDCQLITCNPTAIVLDTDEPCSTPLDIDLDPT